MQRQEDDDKTPKETKDTEYGSNGKETNNERRKKRRVETDESEFPNHQTRAGSTNEYGTETELAASWLKTIFPR